MTLIISLFVSLSFIAYFLIYSFSLTLDEIEFHWLFTALSLLFTGSLNFFINKTKNFPYFSLFFIVASIILMTWNRWEYSLISFLIAFAFGYIFTTERKFKSWKKRISRKSFIFLIGFKLLFFIIWIYFNLSINNEVMNLAEISMPNTGVTQYIITAILSFGFISFISISSVLLFLLFYFLLRFINKEIKPFLYQIISIIKNLGFSLLNVIYIYSLITFLSFFLFLTFIFLKTPFWFSIICISLFLFPVIPFNKINLKTLIEIDSLNNFFREIKRIIDKDLKKDFFKSYAILSLLIIFFAYSVKLMNNFNYNTFLMNVIYKTTYLDIPERCNKIKELVKNNTHFEHIIDIKANFIDAESLSILVKTQNRKDPYHFLRGKCSIDDNSVTLYNINKPK